MDSLKELFPPAKSSSNTYYDHANDQWFKQRFSSSEEKSAAAIKQKFVPPYLKRAGFVPRKIEDFGDGGALPEIHVAQYPLDMGRDQSSKPGSKILPITVDAHGNVAYNTIVKQNENTRKIVYTQQKDLVPKILKNDEDEDSVDDETQKRIEETMLETKVALEKIVKVRIGTVQPKYLPKQNSEAKYIKYKPSRSGAKERRIRMVEMPVDPLEPPKFRYKRVPKASNDPPVPVMHSPPRPLTVKEKQDWKIPPCISNWKNSKGYNIWLDKRLAVDGRGLQHIHINDNFAKLSEALHVAEQKAREEVAMRAKVQKEMMLKEKERKEQELRALAQKAREDVAMRSKVQKEMMLKEKERKEQELRALAQKARSERIGVVAAPLATVAMDEDDMRVVKESREEREERMEREKIREERKRERRLEAKDASMGKRRKITRDRDRDISEKVALGMACIKPGTEVMYDERLFNQDQGMSSGFATDDQYNVYDNSLFTAQPTLSTLYRPKKNSNEEADPFGLDQFLTEVKKGKKGMEKVGGGGTMRASAGSSIQDSYGGGSGRTRIGFEREH